MPPKAAKGAAPTPLDKKLAASAGKEGDSVWNISQLKQSLQEDSALLEQTLREANQLLVSTSGVPLVDIKGHVSKEAQLKRLKELLPEETSELEARREPVQAVHVCELRTAQIEVKEVLERVDDAGYDAIEKYKLHDGHLDAHKFKKDASVEVVHHTPHK